MLTKYYSILLLLQVSCCCNHQVYIIYDLKITTKIYMYTTFYQYKNILSCVCHRIFYFKFLHFCKETHIAVLYLAELCIYINSYLYLQQSARYLERLYLRLYSRVLLYAFLYKNGEIWNRILYDIHMKGYFCIDKI